MKRAWLGRAAWAAGGLAAVAVAFVVFLWFEAGRDLHYMIRVLWHGESITDDYTW